MPRSPERETPARKTPLTDARNRGPVLGLPRFAWWLIAAAIAIGLLLFVLLWIDQRDNNDFYRADGAAPTANEQRFEPLPAPLPADTSQQSSSGVAERDDAMRGAQPSEAPPERPMPLPETQTPQAPTTPSATAGAPSDVPMPISSPAPRYPPEAFRRGESGTVVLRIHVAADGSVQAIDLVESSRSRLLDRAAVEAVRRWRFRPAQRDGQAVEGSVQVPIRFDAQG